MLESGALNVNQFESHLLVELKKNEIPLFIRNECRQPFCVFAFFTIIIIFGVSGKAHVRLSVRETIYLKYVKT